MVNLIYIIIILVAIFVIIELFKHHIIGKISKLIVLFFLLILILLVSSSYLIANKLIKTENKLIITSAAIFSDVRETLEKYELFNSDLFNITKSLDTRKIYK